MKPGFAEPVADSQASFRALLEAMARPGRIQRLPPPAGLPHGLHAAAAAALLTLADADTAIWTDASAEAREWLVFHTGCVLTSEPEAAELLLATGAPPPLGALRAGTDEAPQAGASLVLQTCGLAPGAGWRLRGPGIEHEHRLDVAGLPGGFAAAWSANNARFPRGFDLILTAGDALAALPRTTRLTEPG